MNKAICISHCTNTLGKGVNPAIIKPMLFNFGMATSLGKGKAEFKPIEHLEKDRVLQSILAQDLIH